MINSSHGMRRRDWLQAGLLGSVAGLQWNLAEMLRADGAKRPDDPTRGKNAIFIFLDGGQSHIDSWDPKPDGGDAAGEFKPIATNLPGLEVCEHMPKLARQADKYAVVRGVRDAIPVHGSGMTLVRAGNRPRSSITYPDLGSVIAKEHASPPGVPPFVSLPVRMTNSTVEKSGYLGVAYRSFAVREDPNGANFAVRALSLPSGDAAARSASRTALLTDLDTAYRAVDLADQNIAGMDRFYQQAFDVLRSTRTREAFELSRETPATRDLYGRTSLGQACLLARRLVQAGVRCVTIDYGSWDTHQRNFTSMKNELLPTWDTALAGLLEDLSRCGLLDDTLVWSAGEMGRTPTINKDAGRDHWGKAMSMMLAGGGIKNGQVLGTTDKQGAEVTDGGVKPEEIAATVLKVLGIDPRTEYEAGGRPITVVRDGDPIPALMT
jgi:uncharacterized protein (DUF1501 family)